MATDRTEEGEEEVPPPDEEPRQPRPTPEPRRREPGPAGRAPEPSIKPGSISRTLGTVALTALAVLVLYTAYQHSRRDDGDDNGNRADASDDTTETTAADSEGSAATLADVGAPADPECPPSDRPSEPLRQFTEPPPMCIDREGRYVATVTTSRGDIEITLDASAAPTTVNNFVFLARWRFYEGARFFDVVPRRSISSGDPVGPTVGFGDAGYTFTGELPTQEPYYPELTVAMENGSSQEPNTPSSRFFIVTGPGGTQQPPDFAVLGRVTGGEDVEDVIRAIETTGTESGTTVEDTVIERIAIREP